jgi:hypothetical protein
MVRMDQIFFSSRYVNFYTNRKSLIRVMLFSKTLKVMQSDYMTKNKKAYIAYNAYTKKNVRAPKKNVRICTQMQKIKFRFPYS